MRRDAYMDVGNYDPKDGGDTRPWMVEGRTMQEQLSRTTTGSVIESNAWTTPWMELVESSLDPYMDVGY